ncbi:Variant-specific surface protein [Giardia duodenalis]|uniref:Variant-specific surface protein n=1 Tax=Giardia intestinalis TaxID=5741 RepID=V6TQT2_GIAIN|nr:Variant-specific surface protein [Giardia intestinalis]
MLAIYFAVGALAAECNASGSQKSECTASKCETLGETEVCTQCQTGGKVPIDGVCKTRTDPEVAAAGCTKTGGTDLTDTEKSCEQCGTGYFLHSGGCYSTAEGTPGRALCTTAGEGVCTQGAEGYFAVPGVAKTGESVVACGDAATGVTVSGKQYKGVDGCTACTAEGLTANAGGTAKCTACSASNSVARKPNADGTACFLCPDEGATAGCSNCSDNGKCETCVSGKILKTDGNTKTCITEAECTAGFFVSTASDVKTCISCGATSNGVTDCATCEARADDKAKAKCLSCTGTKKPKMDGTQCNECNIPGCTNCDTVSQCAVCGDGYRHNANTCQKCTPEHCKACINDVNTCTTCSEGYKLEGEVCVPASTNKSGLSTGAIAGISVAAVVVVGGLVGFLC